MIQARDLVVIKTVILQSNTDEKSPSCDTSIANTNKVDKQCMQIGMA
jgi:hypothetical protein